MQHYPWYNMLSYFDTCLWLVSIFRNDSQNAQVYDNFGSPNSDLYKIDLCFGTLTSRRRDSTLCCWEILHVFCCLLLLLFFFYQLFWKIISGMPTECQTVWIQIRPDIMLGLIWVQTVCKDYQDTLLRANPAFENIWNFLYLLQQS